MTNEHVINSLLTEIQTGVISCKFALRLAYGAGFNEGRKYDYHELKRRVEKYSIEGILLKTYQSIGDVERRLGLKRQNISACCNGKRHTAGGFIWRYAL